MLRKRLLTILGLFLCLVLSVDGAKKNFTLVLDAGHGGKDTGACGKISKEKTLTLRYALAFGRMIEQSCPDVKVVYTRKTDRFLELWQRADVANNCKADLFVSVHINALPKGHVSRGYQTYTLGRSRRDGNTHGFEENLEVAKRENSVILYEDNYQQHYEGFDPNSPESNILFELVQDKNMEKSISLAKFMQRYICSATGRQDKGVHQDNLAVLRKASMPACLLELGFISTPDEEQYLNSDRAVSQFTRGFYNAFVAYKNKVAPGIKIPYKPAEPIPEPVVREEQPTVKVEPESPKAPEASETQEAPKEQEVAQMKLDTTAVVQESAPVFKVQIFTSSSKLKPGNAQFKGVTDADCYQESGMYKYTVGASANYQEIYQLRKSLLDRFPEAFIIAFRGSTKMNVNEAIREYKNNKVKKK
jgi:N-acetylmuramoyl-L-alanine amidase